MTPKHKLLAFADVDVGIQEGRLDLSLLYPDTRSRARFEKMWPEFFASDSTHPNIFMREGDDILVFRTESLIPFKSDGRPSVLMLFGNPASHSVFSGMYFSFEGAHHEHRFWIALRETGFLEFRSDAPRFQLSWDERSRIRKKEFCNLEYQSPFRIGLAVYFSIPSAASRPLWSGVGGLQRLFGRKALRSIATAEQQRIESIIVNFICRGGGVITFHRDAYEGVRAPDARPYNIDLAKRGELYGKCKYKSKIDLLGAPPTRFLHSCTSREVLIQFKTHILESLERK